MTLKADFTTDEQPAANAVAAVPLSPKAKTDPLKAVEEVLKRANFKETIALMLQPQCEKLNDLNTTSAQREEAVKQATNRSMSFLSTNDKEMIRALRGIRIDQLQEEQPYTNAKEKESDRERFKNQAIDEFVSVSRSFYPNLSNTCPAASPKPKKPPHR